MFNIKQSIVNIGECVKKIMDKQKMIGEKVRQLRAEAGLTQEELGKKIGYSAMGVSYLEKGMRKIKVGDLEQIADVLNTDINILLQPITQSSSQPSAFYRRGEEEITPQQQAAEKTAMKEFDKLIERQEK